MLFSLQAAPEEEWVKEGVLECRIGFEVSSVS